MAFRAMCFFLLSLVPQCLHVFICEMSLCRAERVQYKGAWEASVVLSTGEGPASLPVAVRRRAAMTVVLKPLGSHCPFPQMDLS